MSGQVRVYRRYRKVTGVRRKYTLRDSLETLDVLHNHPCFYFTSDKSGLETVMRWLEDIHDYEFRYDKIEYERGPINRRKCHINICQKPLFNFT